jgi:hypothetical protein
MRTRLALFTAVVSLSACLPDESPSTADAGLSATPDAAGGGGGGVTGGGPGPSGGTMAPTRDAAVAGGSGGSGGASVADAAVSGGSGGSAGSGGAPVADAAVAGGSGGSGGAPAPDAAVAGGAGGSGGAPAPDAAVSGGAGGGIVPGPDAGAICVDADGDGSTTCGGDCNDADPAFGRGFLERCDGADNDCDGEVDEDFDLLTDAAHCGACNAPCAGGAGCLNGRCEDRNTLLRCGQPQRDVRQFLRGPAAHLEMQVGCQPGPNTAALLVHRSGALAITNNPDPVRLWIEEGGTLITEYRTSAGVAAALLGLGALPDTGRVGNCSDEIAPEYIMHPEDPFWRDSGLGPLGDNVIGGCGYALPYADIPGFVPMGGPRRDRVLIGYVDIGRGRLWLVEAEWGNNGRVTDASLDLMAWMISGWHPTGFTACQDGFDNDGDGVSDLWDTGCSGPADPNEGAGGRAQCANGRDDDGNGLADFPFDPACAAAGDNREVVEGPPPACANGVDDDADGATDFPADTGCAGAADDDEVFTGRALACADGLDNDSDGFYDFPREAQCEYGLDETEGRAPPPGPIRGVVENLPPEALADWTLCHLDTYADDLVSLDDLRAACGGAEILMGCRPTGQDNLTIAAAGPRADVFFETGPGRADTHVANGAQFYFDGSTSLGFAPEGVGVDRAPCDVRELPDGPAADPDLGTGSLRMCWGARDGHLDIGARCGLSPTLGADYERVVFTR